MSLRDQEIVYKLLVSSSDGQVDIEAASLTVQFTGVNNAPYFDPILPGVLQIFKQSEPFQWVYILPEAVDDDVQDVPIVEYDMSLVDGFMSISSQGVLLIEDLSSSDVPIGTYSIGVRLSDGENLVERQIIVKVYDVSETPIVDDESSSTSEQEGSGGTGDTSQLNGSTSDGTSDGTSVTSEGSSAQVENDES